MPLEEVETFTKSIAYATRRGQQSTARYRPLNNSEEAAHGEQADVRGRVRSRKRPSAVDGNDEAALGEQTDVVRVARVRDGGTRRTARHGCSSTRICKKNHVF